MIGIRVFLIYIADIYLFIVKNKKKKVFLIKFRHNFFHICSCRQNRMCQNDKKHIYTKIKQKKSL